MKKRGVKRSLDGGENDKKLSSLTRDYEKRVQGEFKCVVGLDEAGRGPCAGPVVAAACFIRAGTTIKGVQDSKQTKEEDREITFEILTKHPGVFWSVCAIEHDEIDDINILQASLKAMKTACSDLLKSNPSLLKPKETIALIDGNKLPENMPVHSTYVIKGDSLVFSIAAASIIAKVTRDRIMHELDKKYPLVSMCHLRLFVLSKLFSESLDNFVLISLL